MKTNEMQPINLSDSFLFTCQNCGSCCQGMEIKITPYDILKMSQHLAMSTMDFIDTYVLFLDLKKQHILIPVLKDVKTGICAFRKDSCCSIHKSRSLNCRLFPVAHKDNAFYYQQTTYCKGSFNPNLRATLDDYLSEARDYLKYAKIYHAILFEAEQLFSEETIHPLLKTYFFHILFDYDSIHNDILIFENRTVEEKIQLVYHQARYFMNTYLKAGVMPDDNLWDDYFREGEAFIHVHFKG